VSDPNWSNVSLLLHLDGSNNSTTITDSSSAANTLTAVGDAKLTTTGPKFGSASLTLDGTGDRVTAPYSSALHLESGDFTIEAWVLTSSFLKTIITFGNQSTGAYAWRLRFAVGGGRPEFVANLTTGSVTLESSGGTMTSGTWGHVAVTRSGNTFRLFQNGTLVATATSSLNIVPNNSFVLVIGADALGNNVWTGRIDEVRITTGLARYTASFTAPTAAFPEAPPPNEAYALGASALGGGAALAWSQTVRASGASALGQGAAVLLQSNLYAAGRTALGSGKALLWGQTIAARGGTALGAGKAVARSQYVQALGRTALGAGKAVLQVPQTITVRGGTALGTAKVRIYNDFTGAVDPASPLVYVADMVTPTGVVRVPISSWQATLQLDSACYGQAVLPAIFDLADAIGTATEMIILRQARLSTGSTVEQMMLRFPIETRSLAQGARNYTAALAGYFDAFPGESNLPTSLTRSLQGVRSVTEDGGGVRIRADVDWLLRPGMSARYGATELNVSFINYYVPGNDQFMDIGERA
jgi:Concanavalin A-like lectin/glucanases superfamily